MFPETLCVLFLINTPWAFRMIWSILGNFIDPITYNKIKVLGSDYLGEMQKYINIDQIPQKYKGKGKIPIKYGYCSDLPHDRYPLEQQSNNQEEKPNANDESDEKTQQ